MASVWMITSVRFYALVLVVLLSAVGRAAAATEAQSLKAVQDAFNETSYDRAEKQCAEFVQKFPTSPHLPDAILLQARSRLEQSNYAGAMELLVTNQNAVGAKK